MSTSVASARATRHVVEQRLDHALLVLDERLVAIRLSPPPSRSVRDDGGVDALFEQHLCHTTIPPVQPLDQTSLDRPFALEPP
jgi:hypothetical protein